MEYLDATKYHLNRKFGSGSIPNYSTEEWFRQNSDLYATFSDIKKRNTKEGELSNVAYRGVEHPPRRI